MYAYNIKESTWRWHSVFREFRGERTIQIYIESYCRNYATANVGEFLRIARATTKSLLFRVILNIQSLLK